MDLDRTTSYSYSRNRRGVVKRQHRELYLHTKVFCGVQNCVDCVPIDEEEVGECHEGEGVIELGRTLFILEEDVAFSQVDTMVLDPSPYGQAVILLSSLTAIRTRHIPTYNKLRAISVNKVDEASARMKLAYERLAFRVACEQIDEESETRGRFFVFADSFFKETSCVKHGSESNPEFASRRARMAAQWYQSHLGSRCQVVLLTQSKSARDAAIELGVRALTVKEHLESRVSDIPLGIERYREMDEESETVLDEAQMEIRTPSNVRFPPYWSSEAVREGLSAGTCISGTIRMARNTSNYGFVQLSGLDDVRVERRTHINRALDGDRVVVELLGAPVSTDHADAVQELDDEHEGSVLPQRLSKKSNGESVAGRVVFIQRRSDRSYIGTLQPLDDARLIGTSLDGAIERIVLPSSPNLPRFVMRTRSSKDLEGMRLEFRVDSWPITSLYPRAHWTKKLGVAGDVEVESTVILHDHHVITRDFPEKVLRCLPPKSFVIPQSEVDKRVDLRKVSMSPERRARFFMCSVDPPGCKDIDDALSCEFMEDGSVEIGVHIADVTHFVQPDSALDLEAAQRCTTVYLVDRRTDMLPSLLTTDLCSLVGKADRLTFSVVWTFDVEGNQIAAPRLHKSVICSDAAMSYGKAQDMIDDESDDSGLAKGLRQILSISKILRQRRMDAGAVQMENPETSFEFNPETNEVDRICVYEWKETNRMIEDFMLLANITVATKIYEVFPSHSILRCHEPPQSRALDRLAADLSRYRNHDFKHGSSAELSKSMESAVDPLDPFFRCLVNVLVLRCMNAAVYFCSGESPQMSVDCEFPSNFWHYGLCIPIYTHFTSPIRRYADILVHRLLAAALEIDSLPSQCKTKDGLVAQAKLMSQKHRDAQWAGRSSGDFAAYKFFKNIERFPNPEFPTEVDSAVTEVSASGLRVWVKIYGLERFIPVDKDGARFDAEEQKLYSPSWEGGIQKYDSIFVLIKPTCADYRFRVDVGFLRRTTPEELLLGGAISK
eukprot:GHVH01013225.1.p1 GENE.GHVH01013225.1~~GHVH01013225.1.p1  ORF type:complete len:1005 (+),score=158.29 GHVH01013225.1:30-3044(+)